MANKRSKYADFFDNRQKEREMQRAYQSENANNEAASKEQMAMQAALIGGNFDSSDATKNALATYNKLMLEGAEVAKNAGFKPDSQDYDDFVNYFTYMMWPQDSPISYDDFYNANSKRLENIKAQELEAQTKAEQQKVVDFSNAMQQYDPVTGMPLDNNGKVMGTFDGQTFDANPSMQPAVNDFLQSWQNSAAVRNGNQAPSYQGGYGPTSRGGGVPAVPDDSADWRPSWMKKQGY